MKKILLVLSLSVTLLSCENKTSTHVRTFDLPEIAEYLKADIKNSEVTILNSTGMAICDDYLVILDDTQTDLFKVYKLPELDYLYSWGAQGKGPEEFIRVHGASLRGYKNQLELVDNRQIKIFKILDDRMVMIEKIETPILENPVNGMQRVSDSMFFADNVMSDPSHEHIMLNLKSTEIGVKFGRYPTIGATIPDAIQNYRLFTKWVASNPDLGRFVAFYQHLGMIKIYDRDGQLMQEISINDPELEKVSTEPNVENKMYFAISYATENYVTIFRVNKTESELASEIDNFKPELLIWDWDGNFIGHCRLDMPVTRYSISEKHQALYGVFPLKENEIFRFDLSTIMKNGENPNASEISSM